MKKHLKLISLLSLFVIASTTCFIFAKGPADDKPETVMVKVFNGYSYKNADNLAWIDYGNGKIDGSTTLDNCSDADKVRSNNSKILSMIQKLNLEGYKVLSHSETATEAYYTETWVLTLK